LSKPQQSGNPMKALIIALTLTLIYSPTHAQSKCESYGSLIKRILAEKAVRKFRWISVNQSIVELWANDEAIIVISHLNGVACIIDAGYPADLPV